MSPMPVLNRPQEAIHSKIKIKVLIRCSKCKIQASIRCNKEAILEACSRMPASMTSSWTWMASMETKCTAALVGRALVKSRNRGLHNSCSFRTSMKEKESVV
jgi:hypothetical protein